MSTRLYATIRTGPWATRTKHSAGWPPQLTERREQRWRSIPDDEPGVAKDALAQLTKPARRDHRGTWSMPDGGRVLRDIPPRRVIRAFERLGYEVARVRGSHYVLKHQKRPTISIPRHRTVKVGLLLSKIKAAGITPEEFEKLL